MNPVSRFSGAVALAMLAASCALPVANFHYYDPSLPQGNSSAPATFHFANASRNADRYRWDFGDGTGSEEHSPTHTYGSSGNFAVTLVASKGNKTATHQQRIQVLAPSACLVQIETDLGTMTVELFNATPQHRDNFLKLAEEGYYDGTLFHRVIEGFMVQGGDPDSRKAKPNQALGMGGPGYTLPAELVDSLVHLRGALCAARQADEVNPQKRSSGSQFYLVHGRPQTLQELELIEARKGFRYTKAQRDAYLAVGGAPQLDRDYTVFGRVVGGLEVLDLIAASPTDARDRPLTDVRIKLRVVD